MKLINLMCPLFLWCAAGWGMPLDQTLDVTEPPPTIRQPRFFYNASEEFSLLVGPAYELGGSQGLNRSSTFVSGRFMLPSVSATHLELGFEVSDLQEGRLLAMRRFFMVSTARLRWYNSVGLQLRLDGGSQALSDVVAIQQYGLRAGIGLAYSVCQTFSLQTEFSASAELSGLITGLLFAGGTIGF